MTHSVHSLWTNEGETGAMATQATPAPMGHRLREFRDAKGLDLDEAKVELGRRLPKGLGVSRETIRRIETGVISEMDAPPHVLMGLAKVYECNLSELVSPEKLRQIDQLKELWRNSACLTADDALAKSLLSTAAA